MRPERLQHRDRSPESLIRWGARTVVSSTFTGEALVEACLYLELAGMPTDYHLSLTAQQYAVFRDIDQVAVRLAAHVGNPQVAPTPPRWPVLALLLLGWKQNLPADQILVHAAELDAEQQAQRGLVIVAYMFRELQPWLAGAEMRLPRWEIKLAVPLAARKLLQFERTN